MKVNYQTQRVTVPTAFVTKGRQRVKQHDNNIVYLKNGDEFEIELFNPTSNKILAKINVNGNPIGSDSGIVVRPGERIFLERYLNDAKKFLFQTYEVDAKDPNVQEAIKLNGIVDVEFYDEYKQPYIVEWPTVYHYHHYYPLYPWYQWYPLTPTCTYSIGGTTTVANINTTNAQSLTSGQAQVSNTACYCSSVVNEPTQDWNPVKETGRVEKGSYSDQSFIYDSTSFNYYCNWKCTWKILPDSQKVFVKEDLKVFCPNCGAKRKKESHKFCPNCGSKFS